MKRSDIIKDIIKTIEDSRKLGIEDQLGLSEHVSGILISIERNGMLPPDTYPNWKAVGERATNFAIDIRKRHKWEDEDE